MRKKNDANLFKEKHRISLMFSIEVRKKQSK